MGKAVPIFGREKLVVRKWANGQNIYDSESSDTGGSSAPAMDYLHVYGHNIHT